MKLYIAKQDRPFEQIILEIQVHDSRGGRREPVASEMIAAVRALTAAIQIDQPGKPVSTTTHLEEEH